MFVALAYVGSGLQRNVSQITLFATTIATATVATINLLMRIHVDVALVTALTGVRPAVSAHPLPFVLGAFETAKQHNNL